MSFQTMYTPDGLKVRISPEQIHILLKNDWTHELVVLEAGDEAKDIVKEEVPDESTISDAEVQDEVPDETQDEVQDGVEAEKKTRGRKVLK